MPRVEAPGRWHPGLHVVTTIVVLAIAVTAVEAMPLSLYRYEAQAQAHCPDDAVVWLDFRKGIYYLRQHKKYGMGTAGLFVCRNEARSGGYRRSLLGRR